MLVGRFAVQLRSCLSWLVDRSPGHGPVAAIFLTSGADAKFMDQRKNAQKLTAP